MPFTLPPLPFAKDSLGDHMSAETLDFSPRQASQGYVDKANAMLAEKGLKGEPLSRVIAAAKERGDRGLFNNSAQIWNTVSTGNAWLRRRGRSRRADWAALIEDGFGGTDELLAKLRMKRSAISQKAGLAVCSTAALKITSLHDADTRSSDGIKPLLTLDVLGARLLHRLSQRTPPLRRKRARQYRQLGVRRPELDRRGREPRGSEG